MIIEEARRQTTSPHPTPWGKRIEWGKPPDFAAKASVVRHVLCENEPGCVDRPVFPLLTCALRNPAHFRENRLTLTVAADKCIVMVEAKKFIVPGSSRPRQQTLISARETIS